MFYCKLCTTTFNLLGDSSSIALILCASLTVLG